MKVYVTKANGKERYFKTEVEQLEEVDKVLKSSGLVEYYDDDIDEEDFNDLNNQDFFSDWT